MKIFMNNFNNICVSLLILAFVLMIFYSIYFYSSSNLKSKKHNWQNEQKIDIVKLYKEKLFEKDFLSDLYMAIKHDILDSYIIIRNVETVDNTFKKSIQSVFV